MADYEKNGAQNGEKAKAKVTSTALVNPARKHDNQPAPLSSAAAPKKPGLLASVKEMRVASSRPLPTERGDGSYRQIVARPTLRDDLGKLTKRDYKTLIDIVKGKLKGETQQDDKTMIMERTIQLVAGLPDHSRTQEKLTNSFIDKLWNSLEHPPLLYIGPESKYRRPDGAYNNPTLPFLGARGHAYSRSCKPKHAQLGAQPDPAAIFEAVMARDGFRKNPNNTSSILWYWATIIIHDLFWTDQRDPNKNNTSSYLDLAPLYGNTQEEQDSIRTFKGGHLKPDCFADKRLIGNPPGVCILLVMFNRFHNYVATNLAEINEDLRFPTPTPGMNDEEAAAVWKKHDEEIFQTARLVTSGLYINITLIDYVRNIINLNRCDTAWTLDPRQEMGVAAGTNNGSEAGVGNVVSAEFNLCYRWHSCISEPDEKWIEDFYKELLGGGSYEEMDMRALMGAMKAFEQSIPKDPGERTFSGFKRGPDGRFNDDQLMEALTEAIESPGGSFGGRNVPRSMKPVEILGIMRGRRWNLASLNEFRKHFGMKAYDTFEEINSDPVIADGLRNLYQHPDNVELYPGIVAEERKEPMVPGVGIAPTYTISRVVLSDAVALVRGDRYYTTDYHPGNLTNWGYKEVDYDLSVNHGCSFFKLFMRGFPNHFKSDSIYAHYPMVTPDENRRIMKSLNREHLFNWDRPTSHINRVNVTTYGGAKYILENDDKYKIDWQSSFGSLLGDKPLHGNSRKALESLLYRPEWKKSVKAFYSAIAETLLAEKSYKLGAQTQIDLVRDFGNLAHTHFVARLFNLPIKDKQNPKGIFSELELYQTLALIFVGVFYDSDPAKSFPLRQATKEAAQKLGRAVELNVKLASKLGMRGLYTPKHKNDPLEAYGVNLIKGLSKAGVDAHEITYGEILPTAGAMVPNQAEVFAQAVDFYLSPEGVPHVNEIQRVAAQPSSDETDEILLGYALEGVRKAGTTGLYREAAGNDTILEDDGRQVNIKTGDKIFISFADAANDPVHFPQPERIDPSRPRDSYIHYSAGPHAGLGRDISQVALTELFRAVFRKKGIRRAVGPQGELKKIPQPGGFSVYLTEDWGSTFPFPTSMKVAWDGQ
ncbi:unnamed protein product [Clonostachys solani]|uniref:Linoleate 10R-lipoxygenase n=1 Tax=Clonostachys solani TaxID=160281 RepID=A0A9P0EPM6_9HYPO|nr:unnamed protein product [Clonostachys solani]